jgi:GDPmannose 4,6-dehydratase
VFGPTAVPQDEDTPLAPRSPYACAKAAAWLLCKHYRREHGVYVSCGVFFNHTSERQPGHYLLPKIARQAVQVARGERDRIELDGPDTLVDVGYAPDYVNAAWRTLRQDVPDDYAIGTGAGVRVSNLCRQALELAGARADQFTFRDGTRPDAGNVAATARAANRLGRRGDCYSARWVLAKLVDHYKGQ